LKAMKRGVTTDNGYSGGEPVYSSWKLI